MGYKQRERKRKKSAAQVQTQAQARQTGSSAGRHWLTPVEHKTCCARAGCRAILRPGAAMVYRHTPRETLCVGCAKREGIRYRPSLRWERKHTCRSDRA